MKTVSKFLVLGKCLGCFCAFCLALVAIDFGTLGIRLPLRTSTCMQTSEWQTYNGRHVSFIDVRCRLAYCGDSKYSSSVKFQHVSKPCIIFVINTRRTQILVRVHFPGLGTSWRTYQRQPNEGPVARSETVSSTCKPVSELS
jgi:hypothetical protein